MQKRGIQAAGHQFPVADQQEVGGTGLLDLALGAKQHLIGLMLRPRIHDRRQCRGVVAAGFHHAHVLRRAGVLIVDQNAQRLLAALKVIPHRAGEHHQHRLGSRRRGAAEIGRRAKNNGTQVERAGRVRHGIAAAIDQRAHHVGDLRDIGIRQHQRARALQQPLQMPIHAKYMHGTIGVTEGLESFEAGAGIVQHMRRRTDFDRADGLDLALAPFAIAILSHRHVRSEQGAECRTLGLWIHGVFTVGMNMVAGCSRRSFNAWIIAAAS